MDYSTTQVGQGLQHRAGGPEVKVTVVHGLQHRAGGAEVKVTVGQK